MIDMAQGAPQPATQPAAQADPRQAEQPAGDEHPAFQTAVKMARQALYRSGGAEDVARAIGQAKDPVEALATTAYEMVTVVDDRTQGQVPDELMVSLAAEILGEVADIASAAGVKIGGAEIAGAMQQMLLRYVTEQGMDPSQLQAAMQQVNPAEIGAMLDKQGGAA